MNRRRSSFGVAMLLVGLAPGARAAPAAPAPADPAPPAAPAVAPAATSAAPARKWIEPRADELLRQMGARLARAQRFALEAEETFDEVPAGEPRQSLTNVRRAAVQRPDRFAADATGDTLDRAVWYDGKTLSLLDKSHNTWAQVEAAPTIDATLDLLAMRHQIVVPLADLLYADPYATLIEGVTYGRYLGIHLAAGVPCHHLAFAQESIEWQIWIDAGADPLPRRFAITYVQEPGEPQYTAIIRKWNFEPRFGNALFRFAPPAGAKRMELRQGGARSAADAAPEEKR